MDAYHLRATLLKIEDRLTDDDRKRLHFFLGNVVPRRIRDDTSLSGTLRLIQSLFDQDKINERDFTFLIDAFDEIQCIDAVKILRDHMRRLQSCGMNKSIQSLASILPSNMELIFQDLEDEKFTMNTASSNQRNVHNDMNDGSNNEMISTENNQIKLHNLASIIKNKRLVLIAFLIISFSILFAVAIYEIHRLKFQLKIKDHQIHLSNTIHLEDNQTIQRLSKHIKQFHSVFQLIDFFINVPSNARWEQKGISIRVSHHPNGTVNELQFPRGLYIDEEQNIFIADYSNHRILQMKYGIADYKVVAGGKGRGSRSDQLNYPIDVIVIKETDNLIICDKDNYRVVQWSLRNGTRHGEVLLLNITCGGLTVDDQNFLYVSDTSRSEVKRYKIGEIQGTLVAGGNGRGYRWNQFNEPRYIFVDQEYSLFVSDYNNNRVMKWMRGATEGTLVAGGQGKGSALNQLAGPVGLFADNSGAIYIAEFRNYRVVRWRKGTRQGELVVGGNGRGHTSNKFKGAHDLSFDRYGNLYVVDSMSNSIRRFNIII